MRAVREGWPANTARPIEFNVGRECYRRAWLPLAGSLLLVPLLACGRAAPQGQESSERKAPVRNIEPTSAQPSPQPPSQPLVAISGQKHDAPACPSTSFSEFLKSYVNRLDLQNAFTLRPIKVKSPYYWKHNTEPGDPRYPKWITQDSKVIMPNIRYRYDASSQRYVWDDKDLKLGEVWSAQAVDGSKRRVSPLPYFKVRRLSAARYDVDYIRSGTDSFVMKSGCWHLEEQWEREAIVDCKWPDECRRLRESESEAAED